MSISVAREYNNTRLPPKRAPKAAVVVFKFNMPRTPELREIRTEKNKAVVNYHNLKKSFNVSHAIMCEWLGVKPRNLHNWLNAPEKAKKSGPSLEQRLHSLSILNESMEPEHRMLLRKIAFSPIFGDPAFGDAILHGTEHGKLISWYEAIFPKFESYRKINSRISQSD